MLSARAQSSTSSRQVIFAGVFVGKRPAGRSAQGNGKRFYFAAEKRLSNEFDETIGWAPATMLLPAAGAAGAAAVSVTVGFSGGRAAVCLVSVLMSVLGADAVFGIEPSGRGGFGLAVGAVGAGAAVAVVSAVALLMPTLRARLLKKPSSDWDEDGAAEATRVVDVVEAVEANNGSSGDVT